VGEAEASDGTPLFHCQRVHDAEDLKEVAFGFADVAIPGFAFE
jgi:hypothetical protein